jgi:hypothetical protein
MTIPDKEGRARVQASVQSKVKSRKVEGRQQPRYAEHFAGMARFGGPLMTSDFPTFDL